LLKDLHPDAQQLSTVQAVRDWAQAQNLDHIITPHAPVGPVRSALRILRKSGDIPITEFRRKIDTTAWPLATAGFFKFRKHIPDLLNEFAH
jgi:deoxyribodipyrimidine photo-lyase